MADAMIEWEILEIVRYPENQGEHALIETEEWVGNGTLPDLRTSLNTRSYIRRCQVNSGEIIAFTLLPHVFIEGEKS